VQESGFFPFVVQASPLLRFDAAGNVWWGGPQSSQPIAGSRLYIENAGAIGV
jgi:hypothetical protein